MAHCPCRFVYVTRRLNHFLVLHQSLWRLSRMDRDCAILRSHHNLWSGRLLNSIKQDHHQWNRPTKRPRTLKNNLLRMLGSSWSVFTDTVVQFEQVKDRHCSHKDNSIIHPTKMPNHPRPNIHVLRNRLLFHTMDNRINIHFQRGPSLPMPRQPLRLYRLGCGCQKKSRLLSVRTVLVISFYYHFRNC